LPLRFRTVQPGVSVAISTALTRVTGRSQ
jgi:hypothetical protein